MVRLVNLMGPGVPPGPPAAGPVTVSLWSAPGQAVFTPATLTFFETGNALAWDKYQWCYAASANDAIDDGPVAYGVFATVTSVNITYAGTGGAAALTTLTDLDDDLNAKADFSLLVVEDSPGTTLPVCLNDTDLGGNGSFHIENAEVTLGVEKIEISSIGARTIDVIPKRDWYGVFQIQYTIINEFGRTSQALATGSVSNVPDKPVARIDPVGICQEDGFVDMNVVANDTDADNWPVNKPSNFGLTIDSVSADGGTATIINGGTGIRYTPNLTWNTQRDGNEFRVRYWVKDADGYVSEEPQLIPVTVTPKNAKPRGGGGGAQTQEGQAVIFATIDDGGEADEYANQALTYTIVIEPAYGSVEGDGFGGWIYIPDDPDYNGSDSFQYTVTDDDAAGPDAGLTSDIATVSIGISAVNDQPSAITASRATDEDTTVTLTLTGDDGDPLEDVDHHEVQALTFAIASEPSHGTLTDFNPATGEFTYTPELNFNGEDSFTFTVTDDDTCGGDPLTSEAAIVTITVSPVNDAPTVSGTALTTDEDTAASLTLIGDDQDAEVEQVLTFAIVTGATHGTASIDSETGELTYTPDPNFNGADTVSISITDDGTAGGAAITSDPITITITVNPINDLPIAIGTSATTDEDTAVSLTVTGADGDPGSGEVQTLTFAIASGPANGSVEIDPETGEITYTPAENFNGEDSFTVVATDDETCGGAPVTSEPATVTITVNPVNDAPDAIDDGVAAIVPGQGVTFDVRANDVDIDGDTLTITSVSDGAYGTVVNNGDGTVTYTADPDFPSGIVDYFSYTISDGHGGTDSASKGASYSGSALMAASARSRSLPANGVPVEAGNEGFSQLTPAALQLIIEAGRQRWANVGANISVLAGANFQIEDLPGDHLAIALSGSVLIDRDAAGFGWFVDATPGTDIEFALRVARTEYWATANSRAFGRVDLLTAVMHEMGHLLGLDHAPDGSHSVMEETLATGTRRVPSWLDLAWAAEGRRRSDPHEWFFTNYGQGD